MGARTCAFPCRGDLLDIVFSAEINRYKNRESVQLVLKDVRWAEQRSRGQTAKAVPGCYRRVLPAAKALSREQAECAQPDAGGSGGGFPACARQRRGRDAVRAGADAVPEGAV